MGKPGSAEDVVGAIHVHIRAYDQQKTDKEAWLLFSTSAVIAYTTQYAWPARPSS